MQNDRKILNLVLAICLLVSPLLGIFLIEPPTGITGAEALYGKAIGGLGYGLTFGGTFAVCWMMVKLTKRK